MSATKTESLCDLILAVWNDKNGGQEAAKQAAQKFLESFITNRETELSAYDLEMYAMVAGFGTVGELMASINSPWAERNFGLNLTLKWRRVRTPNGWEVFAVVGYEQV